MITRGAARLLLVAGLAALVAGASAARAEATSPDRFKGLSLAVALAKLQEGGLRVIFSSELVRPQMIVRAEPTGSWPHEILEELLAEHGLRTDPGPSGSLLVVSAAENGSIEGTIYIAGGSETITGARILAVGTRVGALTDSAGRFATGPLPEGRYVLEVSAHGYLTQTLEPVTVTAGAVTGIRMELNPERVASEEIVVRARDPASGRFTPEARQQLDRQQLDAMPGWGHDPLRSVTRFPGVTGADGSGALNVRGGSSREVKIILDGLELYEPQHLKERGGPISIIDSRTIGGVGLLGGAFPAEYGGHMSAVVELDSSLPADGLTTGLAVSSDDSRIASQGTLGERMGWLVSARRGDPSRFLDALGADPSYQPRFWDLFGKISYRVGDRGRLSVNLLGGYDTLDEGDDSLVQTVEEPGTFRSAHASRYVWLTLEQAWSARLVSHTVLSTGRVSTERAGSDPRVVDVTDSRATDLWGLKQGWLYESGRHLLKWGLEIRQLEANYDYLATTVPEATLGGGGPIAILANPQGRDLGAYLADRVRVSSKLEIEVGLRWDAQTYTPGRDAAASPRINAVYSVGERGALRVGWGHFYQPQKIHELQVEDGQERFFPAERAEHLLLSLDHRSRGGLALQVNAYQKRMTDLRPRFENLFDPFGFFPEADDDRVMIVPEAARAEGLELLAQGPIGRPVRWWASYGLARAEDEIDGDWVPRSWDQRHSASAGLQFELHDRWQLAIAGTYHSGRPTTPVAAEPDGGLASGARNSDRLPAYRRVDLRLGHRLRLRGSDLAAFLVVINAFDRKNTCCIADFELVPSTDGTPRVEPQPRHGLHRMLGFGLSWSF